MKAWNNLKVWNVFFSFKTIWKSFIQFNLRNSLLVWANQIQAFLLNNENLHQIGVSKFTVSIFILIEIDIISFTVNSYHFSSYIKINCFRALNKKFAWVPDNFFYEYFYYCKYITRHENSCESLTLW